MLVDFYDSVNGRAIRGLISLEHALESYTNNTQLGLIQREVRKLYHEALKRTGPFTPYFKIRFDQLDHGSHYLLEMDERTGEIREPRGMIHLSYIDSVLQLRYGSSLGVVRNVGWDIRSLKLMLSDRISKFDKKKRCLIQTLLSEFAALEKDSPTEFVFDIDDDDERLSIVAMKNNKHYASSSFYR